MCKCTGTPVDFRILLKQSKLPNWDDTARVIIVYRNVVLSGKYFL